MTKEYTNGEITIIWQPQKCMHSGNCVRLLPKVYAPSKKPWITPEQATSEALTEQIQQCPSGALTYRINNAGNQ